MAQGSNEHRMVFDIRGRRGVVIKVVYAILALLMVASLFLVTGAINIGSILGTTTTGESAQQNFEKQATSIEARLAKEPESDKLLGNLTQTRINTINVMLAAEPTSAGEVEEIEHQLALASEDWSKYLASTSEPSPALAAQAAAKLFQMAELSTTGPEALEDVK